MKLRPPAGGSDYVSKSLTIQCLDVGSHTSTISLIFSSLIIGPSILPFWENWAKKTEQNTFSVLTSSVLRIFSV